MASGKWIVHPCGHLPWQILETNCCGQLVQAFGKKRHHPREKLWRFVRKESCDAVAAKGGGPAAAMKKIK